LTEGLSFKNISMKEGKMRSRLSSKCRVTLPEVVRKRLGLEPGDEVTIEFASGKGVILRRDGPDAAFYLAVSETLGEWGSDADNEAFRFL
jgi:AbrB family looped-hinge helix DNA binding protein